MTLLKRRPPPDTTDRTHDRRDPAVAVSACEYVDVDETALVRITGTSRARRGHPGEIALVVSRAGAAEQTFPAMADGPAGAGAAAARSIWQASFVVPIAFVESASSRFELQVDADRIELQQPRRYVPERGESAAVEEDVDPDARIRQAEAAISWTQRQLTRERDARRKAEEELAAATPAIEARRRELEHVAALERQVTHLAETRQRNSALETQVNELSARVHELAREQDFYEELKERVSELATERDRLLAFEPRVAELTAERTSLATERDEVAAERDLLSARVRELATRVAELDAERERIGALEAQAAELEEERARRIALEEQVSEIEEERNRLRSLEDEVQSLRAEREELG